MNQKLSILSRTTALLINSDLLRKLNYRLKIKTLEKARMSSFNGREISITITDKRDEGH